MPILERPAPTIMTFICIDVEIEILKVLNYYRQLNGIHFRA